MYRGKCGSCTINTSIVQSMVPPYNYKLGYFQEYIILLCTANKKLLLSLQ